MPKLATNYFDDIDLDLDPADEYNKVYKMVDGERQEMDAKTESKLDDTKVEEVDEVETVEEVENEKAEEIESVKEDNEKVDEQKEQVEEKKEEIDAKIEKLEDSKETDTTKEALKELRAERDKLQKQLNELAVTSKLGMRKVEELETALRNATEAAQEPEDEGPSPEEILQHLDNRITEVDAALTKAEQEDPSSAPELRKQLRQLERYYLDFKAQQQLMASQAKLADPDLIVQQAAHEAQQQAAFNAVKNAIVSEYPMLDAKNEAFNENLRDQIYRIYNPMIHEGADPVDSLIEATNLVMRANGIMTVTDAKALEKKAAEEAAKAEKERADAIRIEEETKLKKAEAEKTAAERKKEAVERNIKASESTPPNLANLGKSSESRGIFDKYDFGKMSINEVMRIPDEEFERIEAALALYNE